MLNCTRGIEFSQFRAHYYRRSTKQKWISGVIRSPSCVGPSFPVRHWISHMGAANVVTVVPKHGKTAAAYWITRAAGRPACRLLEWDDDDDVFIGARR